MYHRQSLDGEVLAGLPWQFGIFDLASEHPTQSQHTDGRPSAACTPAHH